MTSNERIINLINEFPYFFDIIPSGITADFDANAFDAWASNTGIAESEFIQCQFILN